MIARELLGTCVAAGHVLIERGRLRLFAQAVGLREPVYLDPEAARAAGYPDLLVPPTYCFTLETDLPGRRPIAEVLDVPPARVLHGEQEFEWLHDAFAGQTVHVETRISGIESKKGRRMELVERLTAITHADGRPVARLRNVVVVRHD